MKIFIDPGHNYSGFDTGACGNGLKEQDITFHIADKLRVLLLASGHEVKMSRESREENVGKTVAASIAGRANMSNEWGAELFISIHCNAYDKKARGTETLLYSLGSGARPFAERVQKAIVKRLGTLDRGLKARPELGVLKLTRAPAFLVETAFIDEVHDAALLSCRTNEFAEAIFEGITGVRVKEEEQMAQTVMKLTGDIYVKEIDPRDFSIVVADSQKKGISHLRYFSCGFFATEKGGKTIPVGNLASGGVVYASAKSNPSWLSTAGKTLTTIYTTKDGMAGIVKTDDTAGICGVQNAVSGIPIILGAKRVPLEEIRKEGYTGDELYLTWHSFLGLRAGKLCYVAMRCEFDEMCWALVALGIYDAVKLDGGGSFIIKDGDILCATAENRRIHNVGVFRA